MSNINKTESDILGVSKRMIESAILLDEALAELLKVETKRIKKLINNNVSIDDLNSANALLKGIIFTMTLTSEKIENGIKLLELTRNNHD